MPRIINIGSINIDHVYAVPHFVAAGETLAGLSLQHFPGGKGLNQSLALARAGAKVCHVGKVGADGTSLVQLLAEAGVDTTGIRQDGSATGHAVIQVTPQGQNCILLHTGANTELDEKMLDDLFDSCSKEDILLLQNEVNCVAYAMRKAHGKGMRIAFNPSPIGPEILEYPLEYVTWFLLNEVEGNALTGQEKPQDILAGMHAKYPGAAVVLTLGEKGVFCHNGTETLHHPAYKVEAVDTTAAGDTFTGYFLASVAMGEGEKKALRVASLASSIAVSRPGAAVSIPTKEEVYKKLAAL